MPRTAVSQVGQSTGSQRADGQPANGPNRHSQPGKQTSSRVHKSGSERKWKSLSAPSPPLNLGPFATPAGGSGLLLSVGYMRMLEKNVVRAPASVPVGMHERVRVISGPRLPLLPMRPLRRPQRAFVSSRSASEPPYPHRRVAPANPINP